MKADWLKKRKKTPSVTNDDVKNRLDRVIIGESKATISRILSKRQKHEIVLFCLVFLCLAGFLAWKIINDNRSKPAPKPAQVQQEELKWSPIFEYKLEDQQ